MQLENLEILFNHFEEKLLKFSSNISLDIMKKEYIHIIIYSLNHLNPFVSDPRQFWKLFRDRMESVMHEAFLLLELCLSAPATLERFFRQMC